MAAIQAYIGQFNPFAAEPLSVDLIDAAESLARHPDRGRPLERGRRELTAVWPYLIRYKVRDGAVDIGAIRHGARRR